MRSSASAAAGSAPPIPRSEGVALSAMKTPRQLEHFPNLVAMFFKRASQCGERPFLWAKREGKWQSTSWREAAETVASLAAALKRIGLAPGDRVMLVSENRPEWCMADLAIMAAAASPFPPTSPTRPAITSISWTIAARGP
jgi:long-subunit acyl-CoA synthetase (AMP-forming)